MPPESPVVAIPGINAWMPVAFLERRDRGEDVLVDVFCTFALWTSTIGVSPVTVIVSARAPTFRSALTVATNVPVSSMPSRLTVLKPVSENVTEYVPGRRSTIRYWPVSSLTTERTFSISDRAGGFDGHAGQHAARRVPDDAGDGCLGPDGGGNENPG